MLYRRQFWGSEARTFCIVVTLGGRRRERFVLSSIFGVGGGLKMRSSVWHAQFRNGPKCSLSPV